MSEKAFWAIFVSASFGANCFLVGYIIGRYVGECRAFKEIRRLANGHEKPEVRASQPESGNQS